MRSALLLMLVAAVSPGAAVFGARADDERALRHLKEVEWPRAYFEQDTKALDHILADEFQMVDGEGAWTTKADELAWIAANPPAYRSLTFQIRRLEVFPEGVAIIAGTGTVLGDDQNGPWKAEYQSTNVLIRRAGRWQAIASHVSGYRRIAPSSD